MDAACDAAGDALHVAEESARFVAAAVEEGGGVNEDEATFPGVHSTCRACRAEWLWRHALAAAGEKELDGDAEHGRARDADRDRERERERDGRGALLLHALGANPAQPGAFAARDPMVRAAHATLVDLVLPGFG